MPIRCNYSQHSQSSKYPQESQKTKGRSGIIGGSINEAFDNRDPTALAGIYAIVCCFRSIYDYASLGG
jgi:hypothetical protein